MRNFFLPEFFGIHVHEKNVRAHKLFFKIIVLFLFGNKVDFGNPIGLPKPLYQIQIRI